MTNHDFFARLFALIDARDARFADLLGERAPFTLGNQPPVVGRAAVREFAAGFFGAIGGLRHTIEGTAFEGDRGYAHGSVTYTRKDGSTLTVPFAAAARLDGAVATDVRTFVDASRLFAP